MTHIEITSRVGADGVLTISLPLGPGEANREVKVVVEPTNLSLSPLSTTIASERVLAKDWLRPEEDEAWRDL